MVFHTTQYLTKKIELDCIWTILLDIINYTKQKDFRCVIGICDIDMRYPELYKKHSNVDGDIIMHILRKDKAARVAWVNAMLNNVKQCQTVNQESLHTFATASLLG